MKVWNGRHILYFYLFQLNHKIFDKNLKKYFVVVMPYFKKTVDLQISLIRICLNREIYLCCFAIWKMVVFPGDI